METMYPEKGRLHKAHSQSNWGENHHSIDHIGENISPFCQIWEFVIFYFEKAPINYQILKKYQPFYCKINHKFKNINHLSKMVDYRPMVDNVDPVAAMLNKPTLKEFVCHQVFTGKHLFINITSNHLQKFKFHNAMFNSPYKRVRALPPMAWLGFNRKPAELSSSKSPLDLKSQ